MLAFCRASHSSHAFFLTSLQTHIRLLLILAGNNERNGIKKRSIQNTFPFQRPRMPTMMRITPMMAVRMSIGPKAAMTCIVPVMNRKKPITRSIILTIFESMVFSQYIGIYSMQTYFISCHVSDQGFPGDVHQREYPSDVHHMHLQIPVDYIRSRS